MTAERISIDQAGTEFAFARCRAVIAAGGVVVYPTDTFYGLGVDPANDAALERLFLIKGRKPDQPILLLVPDAAEVEAWAAEVPAEAKRLMKTYWPGPLTLVFKARQDVSKLLTAGTGTIGLRVPGNELTRGLLARVGHALTGTSSNRSGQPAARTADEAFAALGAQVDLVLDGGVTECSMPSTVADVRNDRTVVIRKGAVDL
jgi:L-threonylcarbamoyladenylate synthase